MKYGVLELIKRIRETQELIVILAQRDFSVKYRQSIFGWVWAVLPQVITVAIFGFLANQRIFVVEDTQLPYLIHALWSVSLWQLFSGVLIGSTTSLVNAGALVTKINFPKEALVLSSIAMPVLDFFVRLVPIVLAMIWLGFCPSIFSILIVVFVLLTILLALAFGFVLSILNLVVRDVVNVLNIILGFGIFFAPILYPPPESFPLSIVNYVNPFSPLLIATQECLAGTGFNWGGSVLCSSFVAVFLFYWGWKLFCITIPRVVERA